MLKETSTWTGVAAAATCLLIALHMTTTSVDTMEMIIYGCPHAVALVLPVAMSTVILPRKFLPITFTVKMGIGNKTKVCRKSILMATTTPNLNMSPIIVIRNPHTTTSHSNDETME
jgi:hypothetical protein